MSSARNHVARSHRSSAKSLGAAKIMRRKRVELAQHKRSMRDLFGGLFHRLIP